VTVTFCLERSSLAITPAPAKSDCHFFGGARA
jgi:hypothetical protein